MLFCFFCLRKLFQCQVVNSFHLFSKLVGQTLAGDYKQLEALVESCDESKQTVFGT